MLHYARVTLAHANCSLVASYPHSKLVKESFAKACSYVCCYVVNGARVKTRYIFYRHSD